MSKFTARIVFVLVLVSACHSQNVVNAISITTQYIWPVGLAPPGQPTNPNSVIAPADPTSPFAAPPVGLNLMMGYAADYYGDIFEDAHNLHINFWYENLGGFIGDHDLVTEGPMCANLAGPTASCRELVANIQLDAAQNWFIDFSPALNEEFNMQQTLWRDISPAQRGDWYVFGPGIPDTFEVGYTGTAVDPLSIAGTRRDMLSTVLHEVGHAPEISSANNSTVAETADGNYDFDSDFVFGRDLAADVRDSAGDAVGHLDSTLAGMNGFNLSTGTRVLPSHTDLFAMAAGHSYLDLDVPRREYYGGTDWHTHGNWSGNTRPGSLDDVYVRDGHSATLSATGFAANLYVSEQADVSTADETLQVGGTIVVEGGDLGSNANLVVNAGGHVVAADIVLNDGGLMTLTNAASVPNEVEADNVFINPGGVLLGNGDVRINDLLSNSGAISAIAGAGDELALLGGPVDLDGDGGGEVFAVLGDLRVSANTTDPFDGQMTIGAGHQVQLFGSSWQVGQSAVSDAEIRLDGGGASDPARLIKTISFMSFVGGVLDVSGRGILQGTVAFENGSETEVDAGGRLTMENQTTYRGGFHHGAGELQFNGPLLIEDDTTLAVDTVDLDGDDGTTTVTIDNSVLTLNVESIDTLGHRFDGVMHLNGSNAVLAVNLANPSEQWQMDGTVNANGSFGAPQDNLTGNPLLVTGTINTDNNVQFSAPLDIAGTVTLVDGSSEFWLAEATHVIRNTASVSGPGQIVVADTGTLLIEDGATIDAEVFSLGRVEPGTSLGTALIDDDFSQQSSGSLGVELSGAPFTSQDLLQVTGTASLAGQLEVTVIEGAMPSIGSIYTLLTADTVSGQFEDLTLLSETIFDYEATLGYTGVRVTLQFTDVTMLGDFVDDLVLDCQDVDALVAEIASGGGNLDFDLNGDTQVDIVDLEQWLDVAGTFNVGGPYLAGDANLDGTVDGADFIVWNTNKFTATAAWCSADFNASGFVDGADFIIWNGNKFMSSDLAAVPEPASSVPILTVLLAALVRRKLSRVGSMANLGRAVA